MKNSKVLYSALLIINVLLSVFLSSCKHELIDSFACGIKNIGSGDGLVWAPIHFKIRIPEHDSLSYCQEIIVNCPNEQDILIEAMDVWLNNEVKSGKYKTRGFRGYTVITNLPYRVYIEKKVTDVFSNDSIFDIYNWRFMDYAYVSKLIKEPIPGRRFRIFEKNGVKVYLYNILPENMEKYYKILYKSVEAVPFEKSYLRNWRDK